MKTGCHFIYYLQYPGYRGCVRPVPGGLSVCERGGEPPVPVCLSPGPAGPALPAEHQDIRRSVSKYLTFGVICLTFSSEVQWPAQLDVRGAGYGPEVQHPPQPGDQARAGRRSDPPHVAASPWWGGLPLPPPRQREPHLQLQPRQRGERDHHQGGEQPGAGGLAHSLSRETRQPGLPPAGPDLGEGQEPGGADDPGRQSPRLPGRSP